MKASKLSTQKFYISVSIFLLSSILFAQDNTFRMKTDPPQRIDARFRLFKTENIWTQLLLDTRNGRVWQIIFSIDDKNIRAKIPINNYPLVEPQQYKDGRFTLYQTENMWNFLLLDQDDGRVWQCQFSMEGDNYRFIIPIVTP